MLNNEFKKKPQDVYISVAQEELTNDSDGKARDRILKPLYEELLALKSKEKSGLSQKEYLILKQMLYAVASAGEVVSNFWKRKNQTQ